MREVKPNPKRKKIRPVISKSSAYSVSQISRSTIDLFDRHPSLREDQPVVEKMMSPSVSPIEVSHESKAVRYTKRIPSKHTASSEFNSSTNQSSISCGSSSQVFANEQEYKEVLMSTIVLKKFLKKNPYHGPALHKLLFA